jgi:glutathione S-transferase
MQADLVLYYIPGACSLAPHIMLREAGRPFALRRVDLATRRADDGSDFLVVNAKGSVPVLELEDGQRLTESAVIVQYIADLEPALALAPPAGTLERYRQQEALNFVASELHKTFTPLFLDSAGAEWKAWARAKLAKEFDYVAGRLAGRDYVSGARFGAADAYLFTVLRWCGMVGLDLQPWPALRDYLERIALRPQVQAALVAEGLA